MKEGVLPTRYAKALVNVAQKRKVLATVLAQLPGFKKAVASLDLTGATAKPKPLMAALKKANVQADMVTLVGMLAEANRLALLPAVLDAVQSIGEKASGIARVKVETAQALTDAQRAQIVKAVQPYVDGAKVIVDESSNSGLQAGFRAFFGGMVWDASLRGRFQRLKEHLAQANRF
jgi:F-type H+-transporting ATPase subunit delta